MSTVYIVSDFGKMQKKGETISVQYNDGNTTIIFPYKVEQIVVIGNIEITGSALKMLMRYKIDTVFMNKNGKFDGKLVFQEGKNVLLRQKQYKLLEDEEFKVRFCKSVIEGKLKNQYSFMQRIKRERNIGGDFNKTLENMRNNIQNLDKSDNIEQIRGYEGLGSRYYFSIFKHNILPEWAEFKRRSMNPPEDNVNAVLSFLYTLINYRVEAAIESEGLDSYVGYLHTLDYGRKSLIFDLMEEYRTPIADTLTASLFNLGTLSKEDFREVTFGGEDEEYPLEAVDRETRESAVVENKKGVLLTKEGLKKVITQFEKKIDTTYYYQPQNRGVSYKQIIREQVKHFKRVILGEEKEYKPLVIK